MHLSTSKIRTYAAPMPTRITGWPITCGGWPAESGMRRSHR